MRHLDGVMKRILSVFTIMIMMVVVCGCKTAADKGNPPLIRLSVGDTLFIDVSDTTESEWVSDDEAVLSAEQATERFLRITALKEGIAVVKDRNVKIKKEYRVQVVAAAQNQFEFENGSEITVNLDVDEYCQIKLKDTDNTNLAKEYTFFAGDKSLATVNANGLIRCRKMGVTEVFVTHQKSGIAKSLTLIITGSRGGQYAKLLDTAGVGTDNHVQGITSDSYGDYFYYSFTDRLIKQKADGEVVGSVVGFGGSGHLGDVSFNETDGRVYASYITKIAYGLPDAGDNELSNCYVLIFDVDKITSMNMRPDSVVNCVYVGKPIVELSKVSGYGQADENIRLGGKYGVVNVIDSMAFGPKFGEPDGKKFLTLGLGMVAAGAEINGVSAKMRTDNDYITLLQFDTENWEMYETPFTSLNTAGGPQAVDETYFYYMGYHDYGIQNIMYDEYAEVYFLSSYGVSNYAADTQFPNYMLYVLDAAIPAESKALAGNGDEKGLVVSEKCGILHEETGIKGYELSYSVGMHSMGDGYYYIASAYNTTQNKQGAKLNLYRWHINNDNQTTATNPIVAVE